ncbi:MAG: hypothetical protein RIQ79_1822 [Verrucomicrobiota bacterium]
MSALNLISVPSAAFLDGIGGMEMMLVFVIGLLLFGGKGLPDMARTLGKAVREFKKATANVEEQFKQAMEEPPPPPPPRPAPRIAEATPVPPPAATETPPSPFAPEPPANPPPPNQPPT